MKSQPYYAPDTNPTASTTTSPSQIAISSLSGSLNASESAEQSGHAASQSNTCAAPSTACSAATPSVQLTMNKCTSGPLSLSGTVAYDFSDTASCETALTDPTGLAAGKSITRLLNFSVSGPSQFELSVSSAPSGFDTPVEGGTTVTCGTGGCAANRTVNINGDEWKASSGGTEAFDFTVSSNAIAVSGIGGTRKITSGTIMVQSNLTQEVAQTAISEPLQTTAGCCYPTQGAVITSYLVGTNAGKTETMVFGPACGVATLLSVSGQSSAVTLSSCF